MAVVSKWMLAYWDPLKDKLLQSTRGKQALLILHPQAMAHVLAATSRKNDKGMRQSQEIQFQ